MPGGPVEGGVAVELGPPGAPRRSVALSDSNMNGRELPASLQTPKPSGRTAVPQVAAQRRSDHHCSRLTVGSTACRAHERSEEPVEAFEVTEALTDGQVAHEALAPAQLVHVDAALGGHQRKTERTKNPVERPGVSPSPVSKAVEHVHGVELGQASTSPAFTGEANVGNLSGSKDPMVIEQTAEQAVTFGQPSEYGQQPPLKIPRPVTTSQRFAIGRLRRTAPASTAPAGSSGPSPPLFDALTTPTP